MPNSCFAPGCSNRKSTDNKLLFYRLPKDERRRKLWLNAIKRDKVNDALLVNARLCSHHFIGGKFILLFGNIIKSLNIQHCGKIPK